MARRRRRGRRRWSSRLRRRLVEHKLIAAQAFLGTVALVVVLSLLWPQGHRSVVDHRAQWEHSLKVGRQTGDAAFGNHLVAVARAGVAVSAKRQLVGGAVASHHRYQGRLRQVAEAMPTIAIGDPDRVPFDPKDVPTLADMVEQTNTAATMVAVLGSAAQAVGPARAHVEQARLATRPPERNGRATPTWLRNAVATPLANRQPAIAVVLDDLGLNRRGTRALNDLEAPLTLSFLPYADGLAEQTRAARAAGHELLLHMPMEPVGSDWPGPNALVSTLEPGELVTRLRRQLRSFRGFVGVNNHMGSLLTTDRDSMALVMAELRREDLLFLDSRTTPASVASVEAGRMGVPFAERDVFIDNEVDFGAVQRQLASAERIARRDGYAVAIGHPHDVTITALRQWLPTLAKRGITLVPISAIVARRTCADGVVLVASGCQRYVAADSVVVQ